MSVHVYGDFPVGVYGSSMIMSGDTYGSCWLMYMVHVCVRIGGCFPGIGEDPIPFPWCCAVLHEDFQEPPQRAPDDGVRVQQ
jgi:hypothetical protein